MSLLDLFKPKWKHGNPAVRLAAVATLADQAMLARIASEDASDEVRVAATRRLTEKEVLGWLASSAESVRVREAAVERVVDLPLLRRAAACDESAWVRGRARWRAQLAPNLPDRLRTALAALPVTPEPAERVELRGTADEIGLALLLDRRFCLNGQLAAEPGRTEAAVDFLAAARADNGEPSGETAQPVSYLLSVRRHGTDAYSLSLREHRYQLASNAAALGWLPGQVREGRPDGGGKSP
jgi:hypothetical protein